MEWWKGWKELRTGRGRGGMGSGMEGVEGIKDWKGQGPHVSDYTWTTACLNSGLWEKSASESFFVPGVISLSQNKCISNLLHHVSASPIRFTLAVTLRHSYTVSPEYVKFLPHHAVIIPSPGC